MESLLIVGGSSAIVAVFILIGVGIGAKQKGAIVYPMATA